MGDLVQVGPHTRQDPVTAVVFQLKSSVMSSCLFLMKRIISEFNRSWIHGYIQCCRLLFYRL